MIYSCGIWVILSDFYRIYDVLINNWVCKVLRYVFGKWISADSTTFKGNADALLVGNWRKFSLCYFKNMLLIQVLSTDYSFLVSTHFGCTSSQKAALVTHYRF